MSLDAIAKKYFAVWVCGLVGTAAYFQASGVGSSKGAAQTAAENYVKRSGRV